MSIHLSGFSVYLTGLGYSKNTIRSYLLDISKFISIIELKKSDVAGSSSDYIFTVKLLSKYLSGIYGEKSYNRQIASIKVFCQYGQSQNILPTDTFKKAIAQPSQLGNSENKDTQQILAEYTSYLQKQKVSTSTVRSYTSDIKDYLNWAHEKSL